MSVGGVGVLSSLQLTFFYTAAAFDNGGPFDRNVVIMDNDWFEVVSFVLVPSIWPLQLLQISVVHTANFYRLIYKNTLDENTDSMLSTFGGIAVAIWVAGPDGF